ncbi:MAG: DHH family phosphoesterase [Bacilli bacterium]|nr:DHH family phosphoesterase [Bacilli bacterium]
MKKAFRRIRLAYTIFAGIEVISIMVLSILYFLNLASFQDIYTPQVSLIIVLVVIVANLIFCGAMMLTVLILRHKNDLTSAQLLGQDVQSAYNFGMLGLILVDENDTVIWYSDMFRDRDIKILDDNILLWQPRLKELKSGAIDHTTKILINSHYYEVKYLREARLYLFKDTTDLQTLSDYSKAKASVVGIIIIDNYSEVGGNAGDSSSLLSKVGDAILNYAKAHKVLLRRFRNDAYFAVCDFASLQEMEDDQFSILERVRIMGAKESTPPTLSVGFAHGFPDFNKLNEMVTDAIDIAMSRGGDQAVISKYGDELKFFGGKTEALETRNKVKVRVLADSLIATIKLAKNVLVLGHTDADMDAIGSCLGIMAMCQHLKKPCRMVYDPKLIERKARAAFIASFPREQIAKMIVHPKDVLSELKPTTLVILVDCHRPSLSIAPRLIDRASKIVVIDHHRRSEEFVEMPVFSYIEPSASSASELISELIHYATQNPKISVSPAYATIMLSGIFLDSNFFKTKTTGIRTFEASMLLKEFGADNSKADDFLKDEFEEYSLITQIASTLKTPHVGIVYCKAEEKYNVEPATLAKVANQCLQMKGVNASFVIGKISEKEARISCRSDGTVNVQLLAEKMGGGGHFTGAAVPLKNMSIKDAEASLLDTLTNYLKKAQTTPNKEAR